MQQWTGKDWQLKLARHEKEQEAKAKKMVRTKYEIKQQPVLESKYLDYLGQVCEQLYILYNCTISST